MARRTRSLNELPGHIRVPILRRKDTQRTKDRLAAGLAGMEELKSLRQLQQQLVGETVARAGDKRQERRHGDRNSPETSHCGSTRQMNPNPRTCFHGHSMDSISEETDGPSNVSQRGVWYNNTNDENNNVKDSKEIRFTSSPIKGAQFRHNGSASPHLNPQSKQNTSHHVLTRRNYNYNDYGEVDENVVNPTINMHNDSIQLERNWNQNLTSDESNVDKPVPYRRRAMSLRPGCPESMAVPNRQRSSSIDMGQCSTNSFNSPLHQIPLSKHGNGHTFSSLTSVNGNNSNDPSHIANFANQPRLNGKDRSRLSQSMSQLNDIGRSQNNMPSSSLKRRGSLTWDSLLKSMGIQNSETNNTLEEVENQSSKEINTPNECDSDEGAFENTISKNESDFIMSNRKKGRSMSFTCSNHTPLLDSRSYRIQPHNDSDNNSVQNGDMSDTNLSVERSIRPILRRASIQCEAVLTQTKRVLNPIQDVDINSFNNPGPLHAVMLQYRGYNTPRNCHNLKPSNGSQINRDSDSKRIEVASVNDSVRNPNHASTQLKKIAFSENACNVETQETPVTNVGRKDNEVSILSSASQNRNVEINSPSYSPTEDVSSCKTLLGSDNPHQSKHDKSMPPLTATLDKNAVVDTSTISNGGNIDVQLEAKDDFPDQTTDTRVTHYMEHSSKCGSIEDDSNFNDVNRVQPSDKSYEKNNIEINYGIETEIKSTDHTTQTDTISHKNSLRNISPTQHVNQVVGRMTSDLISSENDLCSNRSFVQNKTHSSPPCQFNAHPLTSDNLQGMGFNNKRCSIFSDVSLISEISARTPSSSASVFSDVSMVSDEGYVTSEPFSPDHRYSYAGQIDSTLKTCEHFEHPVENETATTKDGDCNDIRCSSFRKIGTTFDNNGNTVTKYTECYPEQGRSSFIYENNVVHNKENQPSAKLERCGNQFIARRPSVKQTAV